MHILNNLSNTIKFLGYASIFNTCDAQNDYILPCAFSNMISPYVKLLWEHDNANQIGVAKTHIDDYGLYVIGYISMSLPNAMDIYQLIKTFMLNYMSIGYYVIKSSTQYGIRYIHSIDLQEISLVSKPANILAKIHHVDDVNLGLVPVDDMCC